MDWKNEHGKMSAELQNLLEQRTRLDVRIGALQKAVVACEAAIAADATAKDFESVSAETEEHVLGGRITEKIKYVLADAGGKPLTAREILAGLTAFGSGFAETDRAMATVHSVCRRLVKSRVPVAEETTKDGRKAWKSLMPFLGPGGWSK
jgi:hypothetical protein